MRLLIVAAFAVLASAAHAAPPRTDPATLLGGRTSGQGHLRILLGKPRLFRVESDGRMQPDGSFRLDQCVMFEGEPPESRYWIVRPTGQGRFDFTLSDAAGPGTAVAGPKRLTLRYPLRGGVRVRQVLVPSADGRTIANTGSIRWLGLPIGRLSETITRVATGVDGSTPPRGIDNASRDASCTDRSSTP